jgi:2-polyprenyl-6-methoxyphenol hydroxylase-like FAD-dependent oxidoreductase
MAAIGGPYPRFRNYRGADYADADFVETRPITPAEPYARPLMLPQYLIEAVMREKLAELGHAPEFGHELVRLAQDNESVEAEIAADDGREAVRAHFLIGADGGRSFVRRALDIGFSGETLPGRGLVADISLDGLTREVSHRWNADRPFEQILVFPLAGTELFQLQGPVPAEGEIDVSAKGLERLIAERSGRADIRVHAVQWASVFGMNMRVADRYRIGRALLVGDAAHVHPPTGGQGLNTSIQDSYNLGWKLAAVLRGAPDALLDTYEAERRPIAVSVLELTLNFLRAALRGDMRRGQEAHEMDLGYFDSPLALDCRTTPGTLRAGARAPDAPCTRADGSPIRLFEIFRAPHWTLIGYGDDQRPPMPLPGEVRFVTIGANGDLRDSHGHFAEAYGLNPGDCVLVRPDGYAGAIVPKGQEAALEKYFQGISPGFDPKA